MRPLTMPPLLRPGDRVAVVTPSGPVPPQRLDRGLAWLRAAGLEPVEAAGLRHRGGHGLEFVAGDDDIRTSDLVRAWCDPTVAGVLCARGGDGAPRLLERLPWPRLAAAGPRLFAGLSDITTLHQAFACHLEVATLWSPMPGTSVLAGASAEEPADAWSRQGLLDAVLAEPTVAELRLSGEPLAAAGPARSVVEAPLVGGTVSLLAAMAGTPGAVPATGAIAVLEDVNEEPYRIERFLTQLRRSGFFDGVLGVACGNFVACGAPGQLRRVLEDRLGDLGVPVVAGLPFGHGPRQASLWLGRPAALDARAATLRQPRPA